MPPLNAKLIRDILEIEGMSREDLTDLCAVGLRTVDTALSGKSVSRPTHAQISAALKIDTPFLLARPNHVLGDFSRSEAGFYHLVPNQPTSWTNSFNDEDLVERFSRFQPEFIIGDGLAALREFAIENIQQTIAPLETLQGWLAVNPGIFYGLHELERTGNQVTSTLVGYYSLRPINRTGMQLLDSGKTDGASLLPEHILPAGSPPSAVYIGGVAAGSAMARAAILFYLYIEARRFRAQGVNVFYTYPASDDGRRLAMDKGFVPIPGDSGVYTLRYP